MSEDKKDITEEDLDDLLDAQWEMQDKIHKRCKMKDKKKYKKF